MMVYWGREDKKVLSIANQIESPPRPGQCFLVFANENINTGRGGVLCLEATWLEAGS